MLILQQIILGIIFIVVTAICFTMPALVVLKKLKVDWDDLEKLTVASVLGLVIFTLVAYLLAALNLRILMWVFPILGVWSFWKLKSYFLIINLRLKYGLFFLAILIIGIIGQVAVNVPSGFFYQDGLYFWSSHGHDGIWHAALMEEMHKNTFPFANPELADQKLQNYHFFSDLLMSELTRIFPFSNLDVYFRFMPIIFSLLLGLSSFIFVRSWGGKEMAGIWAMIFVYFAGSFGYLRYIPTHQSLGGEAIFWVSQTQSVLGNPPHASAFIIMTIFLFCFLKYLKGYSKQLLFLCTLLGGAVIEFKVYAGILILGGLIFLGIYELLIKRKWQVLFLFTTTLLTAVGIYLPNSANSQDFLVWHPWWYIRTMVVATDRLNWLDLELRRQTYIAESNWKRVIQVEVTAFLIFLLGNLGMRALGFLTIFNQIKSNIFKNSFNLFFLAITITSFFIPVFFLQKGVVWNSIQFNQYFLLLFGFLAALSIPTILNFSKSRSYKIIVSILIIGLAVPTQIGLLWQFYSNYPLSKITYQELEALNFLKRQPDQDSIVLTAPFNKYEKDKYRNPPIPIYAWYDTGYVSAISGKQTLISDEEQVNIMGYQAAKILEDRKEIFQTDDYQKINEFLSQYNVDYIYLVWDQQFATDSAQIKAELIYENKDAKVFKVKK